MRLDHSLAPGAAERQLALPLEPAGLAPVLVGLGPAVAPRKVWRSLAPVAQAAVRQAVGRICSEVRDDADRAP